MAYKKKLIEVALPLEAINAESAREKTIRHGHPATLHLWWARRPLAVARAVIWASLVDDPSSHPDLFPTEELQEKERKRLFNVLSRLVVWENSNDSDVINEAKVEIMRCMGGEPPVLLDPFAGGGAIPLEAQRLGLEAYAHDLNPVAVMINKAMIDIPARFQNKKPVNPEACSSYSGDTWSGISGMTEDVRYYGDWMKERAFEKIGHLYPQVQLPGALKKSNVISWIWARTVKCPNPACNGVVPLTSSLVLSKKQKAEVYIDIECTSSKDIVFHVVKGKYDKSKEYGTKYVNEKGKPKKGTFCCPHCHTIIDARTFVEKEANEGRMGMLPMAVAVETSQGREYLSINQSEMNSLLNEVENYYKANEIDNEVPHSACRGTFASNAQGGYYGFHEFKDYFTKRQLIALVTMTGLIQDVQRKIEEDAVASGMFNDHIGLAENGKNARAYSEAIAVYLAFLIDKLADLGNSLNGWEPIAQCPRHLFARQAIPMVWDFAEANIFSESSGSWSVLLRNHLHSFDSGLFDFERQKEGKAKQFDAQSDCGLRDIMVSTDPPYYDNIDYSDLSDFFYVWMRQSLKDYYPKLFKTLLVPKVEELIATPYRFDGNMEAAKQFFENGMYNTCCQLYNYSRDDIPLTIYYAFKQSDTDSDDRTASSGWETMLAAIIKAGFVITGTWPMRTEMGSRSIAQGANALASSIILVCRKRPENASMVTKREFINAIHREMMPALEKLQSANIAPVDLAQSAIGPGIGVFSSYKGVVEADGSIMSVRSALQLINQELDAFFNEQEGELDSKSRFCVEIFSQYAFNAMKFGEADTLARAKVTSVQALVDEGVMEAVKGRVRLKTREEIPEKIDPAEDCCWKITQQLARAMERGGVKECARVIVDVKGYITENAKALAYRLYTICERKNWAVEGYAYNTMIAAWPDIMSEAAALKAKVPEQLSMLDQL